MERFWNWIIPRCCKRNNRTGPADNAQARDGTQPVQETGGNVHDQGHDPGPENTQAREDTQPVQESDHDQDITEIL